MNDIQSAGRLAGRFLKSLAVSRGDPLAAMAYAENQNWSDASTVKAAIDAATTSNTSSLAAQPGDDLLQLIRPRSIVGRLTALRKVPFDTQAIKQTGGATSYWVGEGGHKPVSAPSFSRSDALPIRKIIGLSVITEELARSSAAERIVPQELARACAAGLDTAFVDGQAGDDDRPASITYGATTVTSVGDALKDASAALDAFKGDLTTAVWIAHPRTAARAGLKHGTTNAVNLGALGGNLAGVPVLTSEAVPLVSGAGPLILVDQQAVQLAGGVDANLRTSGNATVLMDDPETEGVKPVSLWQANSVGLLAEVFVNWHHAGPSGSVIVVTGAGYTV